jgi:hypothetical protein
MLGRGGGSGGRKKLANLEVVGLGPVFDKLGISGDVHQPDSSTGQKGAMENQSTEEVFVLRHVSGME